MSVVTRSQSKAVAIADVKPKVQKATKSVVNVIPEAPLLPVSINDRCLICKDSVIDFRRGCVTLDPKGVLAHECGREYKALYHKNCVKHCGYNAEFAINSYYCVCCEKMFYSRN
jgi:hypothetical protein